MQKQMIASLTVMAFIAQISGPLAWAGEIGDSKIRKSAQERLEQSAPSDPRPAMILQIDQLIQSGQYSGEKGAEKFLSDFETSFQKAWELRRLALENSSEESIRTQLESVRKSATENGQIELTQKLDSLLAPNEVRLKTKLISVNFEKQKAAALAHVRAELQANGGSVQKLLINEKSKLFDRAIFEAIGGCLHGMPVPLAVILIIPMYAAGLAAFLFLLPLSLLGIIS